MAVYVIQRTAMSLDGYINDASGTRLVLSSPEDLQRVDDVRASCDAILVGAGTIRADDPKLLVKRDPAKKLIKVTLSRGDDIDPNSKFFTAGEADKIVYKPKSGERDVDLRAMLADLEKRGVHRLLVEAGTTIGTEFLKAGLVDELQISIAPFFVGDSKAPRLVGDGPFYHDKDHRMELASVTRLGDTVELIYKPHKRS